MTKTTKIIVGIIVVVIIIVGYNVYKKPAQEDEKESIKIGAILPLSGGATSLGENAKNGIELALADLKKQEKDYSIIYEDDQFNAQKTVTAFNKLLNVDKVKYIIVLGSNNNNAVAPIAQENKIVHVAIATDPKVLNYGFSVKNGSDPVELSSTMAKEVIKRNYNKIYILSSNHEGVLSIINEFKKQKGIQGKIIGIELIDPAEADFRTVLTKAKAKNPDSILLEIIPGKVGVAAKQAKELGITVPLFSAVVFEDQNAINAAGGALEGQWYVNSSVSDNFIERFQKQFNAIPSREAGNGFDSLILIDNAISNAGEDPIKVNDYLHQMKNFETTSIYGGVRVENGNFINTAIVKTIRNGEFVKYEE